MGNLSLAGGLATLCLGWSVDLPSLLCLVGRGPANALRARVEDPCRCLHALDSGPNVEYIYTAQVLARR